MKDIADKIRKCCEQLDLDDVEYDESDELIYIMGGAFAISGRDDGTYECHYAKIYPATRWEPEDVDIVQFYESRNIWSCVTEIAKLYQMDRINNIVECHALPEYYQEGTDIFGE